MVLAIQYVSIIIEILIAIMGLLIAIKKKKILGWGIFATFGIYVFYDFARLMAWNISNAVLYSLFFIATVSAWWAVYQIYKGGKKK